MQKQCTNHLTMILANKHTPRWQQGRSRIPCRGLMPLFVLNCGRVWKKMSIPMGTLADKIRLVLTVTLKPWGDVHKDEKGILQASQR